MGSIGSIVLGLMAFDVVIVASEESSIEDCGEIDEDIVSTLDTISVSGSDASGEEMLTSGTSMIVLS